jgi:hypothetical protein
MSVIWFIANEAFEGRPGEKLPEVIKAKGLNIREFKHNVYRYVSDNDLNTTSDQIIIPHGPIQFINQIKKDYLYEQSEFITDFKNNMSCNDYMSKYPIDWFLNSDSQWIPYGILTQRRIKENVFIRPNSAYKTFTGFVLNSDDFDHEINSLNQLSKIDPEELVIISKPKNIIHEFRTVICNREVIAYSLYKWDDFHYVSRDIHPDCLELANNVAKNNYQVSDVYVCDVCLSDDGAKIVELNSWESSGLYGCDLDIIVDKLSLFAINKLNENYK